MGILRFILALAVVFHHLPGNYSDILVSGGIAVDAFFVLSGFYMSLTLAKNYVQGGVVDVKRFYFNRLYRLYPLFILASLLYCFVSPISVTKFVYPWNFLLIGSNIPSVSLLVLPVTWSLGSELGFYLMVPYISKCKTKMLLIFALLLFILRLSIERYYSHLPILGGFDMFLLGFIVARSNFYRRFNGLNLTSLIVVLMGVFINEYLFLVMFIFALGTPKVAEWKISEYLGKLSYPLYLVHLVVIDSSIATNGFVLALLSVLASVILELLDNYIQKKKSYFFKVIRNDKSYS